jgi:hypothetical protein
MLPVVLVEGHGRSVRCLGGGKSDGRFHRDGPC